MKKSLPLILFLLLVFTQGNAQRITETMLSVTTRATSMQAAAGQPQLYCGSKDGRIAGCWGKEKYDNWVRQNGQLEQTTHGWDGQMEVPDYNRTDFLMAGSGPTESPKRVNLNLNVTVKDPSSPLSIRIDTSTPVGNTFAKEAAQAAQAAIPVVMDFIEQQKVARENQKRFQDYYNQVAQANAANAAALRAAGQALEQKAKQSGEETLMNVASTLASLPITYLSAEQRAALNSARALGQSALRYSTYEMNGDAARGLEKQLAAAIKKRDYSKIAELTEPLTYGKISGQPVQSQVAKSYTNSDGVINVAKISGGALTGPMDKRTWKTKFSSEEGQAVRRLANRFQQIYADSNGLAVLKTEEAARFAIGTIALSDGDLKISKGFIELGSSLLRVAEIMTDSLAGFQFGFEDSITALNQAAPMIVGLLKDGAIALWNDPKNAMAVAFEFAIQSDVGGYILTSIDNGLQEFEDAGAYKRGYMLGQFGLDILGAAITGGGTLAETSISKNLARNLPRETVEAVGAVVEKQVALVKNLAPEAQIGLREFSKRSPETAAAIAKSISQSVNSGAKATATYMQKVAASGYKLTAEEIPQIETIHQNAVKVLKHAPGERFEGVVSRAIKDEMIPDGKGGMRKATAQDVFSKHNGQLVTDHRMTIGGAKGNGGVYATIGEKSAVEKTILREVDHEGRLIFAEQQIKLEKVLDLTDRSILESLNVDRNLIRGDNYNMTQAIGDAAIQLGYDGIKFESAVTEGVVNIVILK